MLALLVLLSLPPESIAPPLRGHFVRDLTGQLNATTLAELEATASTVNASGGGQLGVSTYTRVTSRLTSSSSSSSSSSSGGSFGGGSSSGSGSSGSW